MNKDSLSPYKLVFDINELQIQKLKSKYRRVNDQWPLAYHGLTSLSSSRVNLRKHKGSQANKIRKRDFEIMNKSKAQNNYVTN